MFVPFSSPTRTHLLHFSVTKSKKEEDALFHHPKTFIFPIRTNAVHAPSTFFSCSLENDREINGLQVFI